MYHKNHNFKIYAKVEYPNITACNIASYVKYESLHASTTQYQQFYHHTTMASNISVTTVKLLIKLAGIKLVVALPGDLGVTVVVGDGVEVLGDGVGQSS